MPRPPSGIADLIRLASGSLLLHGYAAAGRVMRHAHRTVCIVGLHSGSREYFFGNDMLRLHCGQLLVIAAGHVHGCGEFYPQSTKGGRGNGGNAGGQGCVDGCVEGRAESRVNGRANDAGIEQSSAPLYSTLCVSAACLPVSGSRIIASPELVARLRDLDDAAEGLFLDDLAAQLTLQKGQIPVADENSVPAGSKCPQEISVMMRSFLKGLAEGEDVGSEIAAGVSAVGYSVRFSRQFRAAVGLPPVAWQMLCRIRHGASLLAGGASITDAALASGFYDQSHFAHRFRQLMGMTPGQYQVAFSGSKDR